MEFERDVMQIAGDLLRLRADARQPLGRGRLVRRRRQLIEIEAEQRKTLTQIVVQLARDPAALQLAHLEETPPLMAPLRLAPQPHDRIFQRNFSERLPVRPDCA
jgi:hypothetical protein